MVSHSDFCLRLIFGLLCLHGVIRFPQVQATVQTVWCQSRKYQPGEIVTTKSDNGSQKICCGSTPCWYFVLRINILFHVQCSTATPTQGKVVLIDMNNRAVRLNTFDAQILCDIKSPETMTTGNNANLIASRLAEQFVPYDRNGCNGQHYVNYLAFGQAPSTTLTPTCPLLTNFNASTNVNHPNFKLTSRNGRYDWSFGRGAVLQLSPSSRDRSFSFNPMRILSDRSRAPSNVSRGSSRWTKTPRSGGGSSDDGNIPSVPRRRRHHHGNDSDDTSAAPRSSKPFWRGLL